MGGVGRDDGEVNRAIANSYTEKTRGSKEDGYLLAINVGLDKVNVFCGGFSQSLTSEAGLVGGTGASTE